MNPSDKHNALECLTQAVDLIHSAQVLAPELELGPARVSLSGVLDLLRGSLLAEEEAPAPASSPAPVSDQQMSEGSGA
jgi:hypothetical protein